MQRGAPGRLSGHQPRHAQNYYPRPGAAVQRGQPQDIGNARVADRPRATTSFHEQRRHGGDVRSRRRGAKERGEIRQGGADPIGGRHVGFGAELMGREKSSHGPCPLKSSSVPNPVLCTSTAPTASTSRTHGWPKILLLATLCLSTVTLPKGLKFSAKVRAGPATRLTTTPTVIDCPVVLVKTMTSSGGPGVFNWLSLLIARVLPAASTSKRS